MASGVFNEADLGGNVVAKAHVCLDRYEDGTGVLKLRDIYGNSMRLEHGQVVALWEFLRVHAIHLRIDKVEENGIAKAE